MQARTQRMQNLAEPSPERFATQPLILAAAAYAAAEIALAFAAGWTLWGRAEALAFLSFRPVLLLGTVALAARRSARERLFLYCAALAIAGLAEGLLLVGLEAANPWPQIGRGLAAGAVLALLFDLLFRLVARFGRLGRAALALGLVGVLAASPVLSGYGRIVLGDSAPRTAPVRPDLMLMTALPIIWGETGAFDPDSRPAAAFTALQREFAVRPLDLLDPAGLSGGRLLLLAQPRALEPEELVALDDWVRGGGKALILTDPLLVWPSPLPLGDARRPPAIGLLGPILDHWGIALEAPQGPGEVIAERREEGARRRLAMAAPGRFATANPDCRLEPGGRIAECSIGLGRAILLADSDLLHDSLWTAPGESGSARHQRRADNPLVIADLLDRLAGVKRTRVDGDVDWIAADADWGKALILGALPLLIALGWAGLQSLRKHS